MQPKIFQKKKKMRFTKPTLLVDEADLETIDYNGEPNEDIFANESVLAAANYVSAFDKYKKSKLLRLMNLNSSELTTNFLLMKAFLRWRTKFLIFTDIKKSKPPP